MSNLFWEKLKLYGGWLAALVLLGVTVFIANIEIKDADLWLHIASGRHILQNVLIPRTDFLSCVFPGKMWINHEWLFQVIVATIYGHGGFDGLIQMQVLMVSLSMILLFLIGYNQKNILFQVFLLFLVLLHYQLRMTHRPDLFSLVFLILFIQALAYRLNRKSIFLILFVLQVIWTNMHGFFILGPMLVFLYGIAEMGKRHVKLPYEWNYVGRLTESEYKNLKICFLLVCAACFINPHFVDGVLYPVRVLFSMGGDSQIFFDHIVELEKSITLQNVLVMSRYPQFKLLIVISGVSFILNWKKLDIGLLALWVLFLFFGISAIRNLPFFAFVAYLVTMANVMEVDVVNIIFPWAKGRNSQGILAVICTGILLVVILNFAKDRSLNGYYDFDQNVRKNELGGVSQRNYASKAVDFLVKNKIQGNFFNDFNSGAYLLGRTHPDIKVSMDGRTEFYGAEFYKEHRKMLNGDIPLFEEAVTQYDLTGVFLGSMYVSTPKQFIRYLYDDPVWVLVYFDFDASIFLKKNDLNKKIIDEFAIDLNQYQTKPIDVIQYGTRNILPFRYINRAEALFNMGLMDKAEDELNQVVRVAPQYSEVYPILARIARERKEYMKEFEYIRIARILDPKNIKVSFEVSLALYHLGELDLAKKRLLKLEKGGLHKTDLYLLLALIYAEQKEADKAISAFRKVNLITPEFEENAKSVGNVLCSQQAFAEAREVFEKIMSFAESKEMTDQELTDCSADDCYCKQEKDF